MFQKTFCSSPWFHLRIHNNGNYNTCRWAKYENVTTNIENTSLQDFYNGKEMKKLRMEILQGNNQATCSSCFYEDKFNKLSGRKKQLLKSGITNTDFEIKLRNSPHYNHFEHSWKNSGESNYGPTDIQIDLGNICNSGCIMCNPNYSSRLDKDYQKLNQIDNKIFKNFTNASSWTKDKSLVDKIINELIKFPNIKYLHFLGGETLYMEAFYKICDSLIEHGLANNIILGTTTNGTIYNQSIEKYIKTFKQFHLGISIETVTSLNDYIRYPSNIKLVLKNIEKYKNLTTDKFFMSLRITPNIFTIYEFDKLAEYSIENEITVESCDILTFPSMLRIELLPDDIRQEICNNIEKIIQKYDLKKDSQNINIRNKQFINQTISNGIIEYYDFLTNFSTPDNVEKERYNLVKFLKAFESLRNNRIVDYVPRYTEFLTNYGY